MNKLDQEIRDIANRPVEEPNPEIQDILDYLLGLHTIWSLKCKRESADE